LRGNLVASVATGATPELVCVARCVSRAAGCSVPAAVVITEPGSGTRSPWQS